MPQSWHLRLNSIWCPEQLYRCNGNYSGFSILRKKHRLKTNIDGDTAQHIFTGEHKGLVEKGEKWMKDTSGSCMVVAALIATVTFQTAFTVPGGYVSDINSSKNGSPVFLETTSFTVFVVADALALFSFVTRRVLQVLATKSDYRSWNAVHILELPLFVEIVRSAYWGCLFLKHRYIHRTGNRYNAKRKGPHIFIASWGHPILDFSLNNFPSSYNLEIIESSFINSVCSSISKHLNQDGKLQYLPVL
ncbi:hypothetical protein C5167_044733 [Papaver somniferum]|nr:hypothetical protein C5167_044733 [Papaver somniferum]